MENITSTGDTRTAVRPVRPLYSLADGLERAAAGGGAGVGICLRAGGLSAGQSYRIMYLHVPAAMWSMGVYLAMAVAAFVGLVWQMKMADLTVAALAPVGAACTAIATVSGAAWGNRCGERGGSGTRLTSELVLLFLYAGIIALWHAFDDRRLAGRAVGILVLVGWSICLSFTIRSSGGTRCIRVDQHATVD